MRETGERERKNTSRAHGPHISSELSRHLFSARFKFTGAAAGEYENGALHVSKGRGSSLVCPTFMPHTRVEGIRDIAVEREVRVRFLQKEREPKEEDSSLYS